jgi:hypothetical protein
MNSVKPRPKQTESFWKNHQWFVQAFESGIMDQEFTVKSVLIGGIPLFTGHGLLLSSDVAQVVAAIGAILATAVAYVQRIGAMLLLGISLGFRSDRLPLPRLFDLVHPNIRVWKSLCRATAAPQKGLLCHDSGGAPFTCNRSSALIGALSCGRCRRCAAGPTRPLACSCHSASAQA